MRRQKLEMFEMQDSRIGCEAANPGRSLVPAAQAQAARSRYALHLSGSLTNRFEVNNGH